MYISIQSADNQLSVSIETVDSSYQNRIWNT